jgi:hypothetical protein
LDLRLRNDAESVSWVVTNSHVNGYICLRVAEVNLNWAAADGEVGTLLLHIVEASAREVALYVVFEPTCLGEIELEVSEGERKEREREQAVGEHVDGWKLVRGVEQKVAGCGIMYEVVRYSQ